MADEYFLVIHCLKKDGEIDVRHLSFPPGSGANIGTPQSDGLCWIHNKGVDRISPRRKNLHHHSESILICITGDGDMASFEKIAKERATSAFGIKGKERG